MIEQSAIRMTKRSWRISERFLGFGFDVTSALPPGWNDQVQRCIERYGRMSVLDGSSVTSREHHYEEEGEAIADVIEGERIAVELPWLFQLYEGLFLDLANAISECRYITSRDHRSAINVNSIRRGARYEWHVDSNPLTGLLFCTSHSKEDGGELVFRSDPLTGQSPWEERVIPAAGTLLLFDARTVAHAVTAVKGRTPRISIPMNFYLEKDKPERPADLDGYLYE